jgi:hypothetical protein
MRALVLIVFVVLAACSSGCTAIGLGLGSAVPRYEPQTGYPDPGVHVKLANEHGNELASGTLEARKNGVILVAGDDGAQTTVRDVDVARIESRRGTYWKTGLIIGIVLDSLALTAATTAAVAASSPLRTGL